MSTGSRPSCTGSTRHQRGFSLLSLMIGLVISLIVLLATLIVFKNMVRTTVSSREDSSSDSLRMSSVLGSQLFIQGAGYGLSTAAIGTDIVVLRDASYDSAHATLSSGTAVAAGTAGNAVIWGADTGSGYRCEGIYAPATGGLWHLTPVSCVSAVASWSTATWTAVVLDDSARSVTQITLTEPSGGCTPFGITGSGGALLTLSTTTTRLNYNINDNTTSTAAQQTYQASSCLANFASS